MTAKAKTDEGRYWQSIAMRLKREFNRTDLLIEGLKKSARLVPVPPPYKRSKTGTDPSAQTMVILLSDCQAGTEVIGKDIGDPAWNYNTDIWRYRMRVFMRGIVETLERHRQSYPVRKGVVWLGGDILENEITFRPQMTFVDTNVMNQFFVCLYEVARWLSDLSRHFEVLEVTCTPGNHGRVASKKDLSTQVNWEYVLYRMLQVLLSNHKNVKITVPTAPWQLYDVDGTRFLFIHGENIKRWLEFPWYGGARAYRQYQELARKYGSFDIMCFGHFHQPMNLEMTDGEMFANGSFVGYTLYTVHELSGVGVPARQWVFFVHPKYRVTARHKIWLNVQHPDIVLPELDFKSPIDHETLMEVMERVK